MNTPETNNTERLLMPCGSPHSCLDCTHHIMVTDPCSHFEKMDEEEYYAFLKKLREKKYGKA